MSRHFGSNNGKCLKTARIFSFEVTRNQKMQNVVKLNALQNSSNVCHFSMLTPKSKDFIFKNNCLQKPKFSSYPKNGIYVIEVHTNNMHAKFQAISCF